MFLVPGYIMNAIVTSINPRRTEEKELLFLRFLSFSALNLIIAMPFLRFFHEIHSVNDIKWWHPILSAALLFVTPTILGIIISKLDESSTYSNALNKFGLVPLHSSPTAWNTIFKSMRGKNPYVVIEIVGGGKVGGWLGPKSCASTDDSVRDIYLEKAFEVGPSGWSQLPRTMGILIEASQIVSMTFYGDN